MGSVAAEMLTRCGVGELLLYDCDRVEMANMNRLFFRPEHVGLPKTRAAQDVLQSINPDVAVTSYYMDVTTGEATLECQGKQLRLRSQPRYCECLRQETLTRPLRLQWRVRVASKPPCRLEEGW